MGTFRLYDSGDEGVRILCLGDLRAQGDRPLLRIHSSCIASEVFGARDCDCADQLRESMKLIATFGQGLVLHLQQEGRGHGLSVKIEAVGKMQREHLDTAASFETLGLEQDLRSYDQTVRILEALGIFSVRLITNNPRKIRFLERAGIRAEMINTHPVIRPENQEYLATKNVKLGHRLPLSQHDDTSAPIRFYHSDQRWGALSNFSPHALFLEGRIWPTVEHYYQAKKFTGTPHEEALRTMDTPMLAKVRARELMNEGGRPDWDLVKEQVMFEGLRAKFRQHPDLGNMLLGTGMRLLVEHTGNDAYWGDGGDGSGQNRLGQLLMAVRLELRHSEPSTRQRR